MKLSKLILDEMVQGIDVSSTSWKLLLLHPEREKVWSEAVTRREKLNRFCYFTSKWPKLSSAYKKTKVFVKDSFNLPEVRLGFDNSNLVTATLSDSSTADYKLDLNIEWGKEEIVEINTAQRIFFNTDSLIRIHYSYSEGEGWLTSEDVWNFQPKEGAVLLTLINSTIENVDLALQIKQADSISKIILLPV